MFQLTESTINPQLLQKQLSNPAAGALATFEGWVRNNNEGKIVIRLEYQAYEALCSKEASKILQEAKQQFDILDVYCVHRVGSLAIGDLAVWIGAVAAHRKDAFRACQYVIDQVKSRVPIWKKEHYQDGISQWVDCASCTPTTHHHPNVLSESEYYSRQIQLPGVSVSGQQALSNSRVLVVGAGGLGSSALLYLAGAGIGTLGICEADKLDVSNLHRQVLYNHEYVGHRKVSLSAKRLQELNPFINIVEHPDRLTEDNAVNRLSNYDLILDCSDNFTTKFLLNDVCVQMQLPLIQASVHQFEGQIHLYRPGGPCLRCLWPEVPDQNCFGSCAQAGVLGSTPGFFGTLQATEAIKFILGLPTPLDQYMLLVDLLSYEVSRIKRIRNEHCNACKSSLKTPGLAVQPSCSLPHAPNVSQFRNVRTESADAPGSAGVPARFAGRSNT